MRISGTWTVFFVIALIRADRLVDIVYCLDWMWSNIVEKPK